MQAIWDHEPSDQRYFAHYKLKVFCPQAVQNCAPTMSLAATATTLVTGLTVVFLYRHYNSNLDAQDLGNAIGTPQGLDKHKWPAPSGPINILVMGSE